MKHLYNAFSFAAIFYLIFSQQAFAQNLVTYAGNSGKERFNDVIELSNGKVLVAAEADNLAWVPGGTPITTLTVNLAPGISSINSADSRVAFLMLLNSTQSTIEQIVRFPAGTVASVNRIRTTNQIGSATADMYISGMRTTTSNAEDGYYIARLNNNFLGGVPTACSWYFPVSAKNKGAGASAYKTIQPWDCGNDGSVVFGTGLEYDWDWAAIQKLDPSGNLTTVENWPYHTDTVGINTEQNYKAASAYVPGSATYSSIVLKTYRSGSLRSSVNGTAFWNGYNFNGLDENNNARKGKFPDDFFAPEAEGATPGDGRAYGRLTQGTSYNTSPVGYRTSFKSTRPTGRLGGIVIDRRDNHMYFGYSTQSAFWSVTKVNGSNWVPDFEPVVVAMNNTGGLKWWARLYNQRDISLPDQYIDAIDIDYAADQLVVLARQHGFSGNMFWKGNQLFFNGGASGFKNSNSGVNTIETGHYTWIGKYDLIRTPVGPIPVQPKLIHATFMAEYSDNPTGLGSRSNDPKLDNWFLPNSGFPDLNTTKGQTRMNVSRNGSVAIVATGRRTITTADAHQKMPKPGTGSVSSWNQFIRVYRPDLSSPVYSSLLTGAWDTLSGIGGSNTEIFTAFPFSNGVYVAGYHQIDPASGTARPNNIPTSNVPTWGNAAPNSESAIFGRLGFTNLSPIALSLTQNTFCSASGSNTATINFTPPPNFLVTFNPGNQFQAELSDINGKFAEDGGTTTVLGSLTSTSNAAQSLIATFPIATPAGTGYGIRVRATDPATPGFWYGASIVTSAPGTPGTISGPTQVCSNASTVTPFTINKVANATTYEWEVSPTVANQLDPCDLPSCSGKISGTDTVGSVVWNPSYSGTATVRVRAVNACGTSSWQTFNVTNISPCITNTGEYNGCAGGTFTVNFTVPTSVTVAGTNQFTAELSDVSGNFPGTIMGTANNVAGGTGPLNRSVSATIPGGQAAGSNYRIRVNGLSGTTPAVSSLVSANLSNIRNIPSVPGTPTGTNTFLCVSQITGTYTYTVSAAAGATDYEWRIVPDSAGTVVSGTDVNATISWNQFVGTPQLQVRAKNSCGNSAWSTALTVTLSGCNTIAGTTPAGPFCPGQSGITVQLSTPAGQNYSPTNTFTVEILDGSGTNLAPANLGQTTSLSNSSPTFVALTGSTASFSLPALSPGNYSFRLRSVSGSGGGTKLGPLFPFTVTGSSPAQPGSITGSTIPTCGQTGVSYSITAVAGASSYNWSIAPASAGTISGSGTSITINFASTYVGPTATLFVSATNSCGTSSPQSLAITLSTSGGCAEPTAPTIPVPSANGNWRSRRNGSWFTPGTWEQHNGTAWIVPSTGFPTSASGIVQIQAGHQVTVNYPINVTSTNSPTSGQLNASANSSGVSLNCVVVGNSGFARYSTNGGTNWTAPTIAGSPTDNLNAIGIFNGGQRAIVVGDNGLIRYANGPAANQFWNTTWNAVSVGGDGAPTSHLRSLDINNGNGIIVGDTGTVVIVSGGTGAVYDNRTTALGISSNLRGSFMAANQAWVVGSGGYFRHTTAASWTNNPTWNTAQTLASGANLNDISFNGANGIIVGDGGVILRTTNGTASSPTWTSITSPTSQNLLSVRHGQGGEAYAVGDNGTILHTTNEGANWTIISGITTEQIRDVTPSNSSDRLVGYMVGANGLLIGGVQLGNGSSFGAVDQIVVENTGRLTIGFRDFNPANGAGVDLDVAGTYDLLEAGYNSEWANGTQVVFRGTGVYRHGRNGGTAQRDILGRFLGTTTVNFLPGSTCEVFGVTGSNPSLKSLLYSNLTWNCTNQTTALTLSNLPTAITGTFRVQSTGTQSINLSGASSTFVLNYPTITLDGGTLSLINNNSSTNRATLNLTNLNVNGGTFTPMADQGLATFNISGQFNQTGGTINTAAVSSTLKGAIFNISGNFLQSGGVLTQTLATSTFGFTQSPIIFMGSVTQNVSIAGTVTGNLDFQINKPAGSLNVTGNSSIGSVALRWIAGNVNTNAFSFTSGPLSLRGAANTTFATLSGTGGMNTNALSIVSGRLDNTDDNLVVTNPSSFTAITGGDRKAWVIGSLRKVFGASVSGSMTFPIGTSSAFKPMAINGFSNDGTQKTLSFSVATSGASQASGTKIQNVGSQTLIGGVNWRIRRTDAPTGSISALSSVRLVNDTLTSNQRIGQTNINLTSGFASLGGNVARNASLSVATSRYYDFTSTKPIDLSTLSSSNGTWFAIGGPSTVTPPGGGYTVGPTGNFPNLTSVAAEYNDVKFTAGTSFNFQSSYEGRADNGGTEVFPITFTENQTVPVTINYTGSSIVETSNSGIPNTNPIVILDGSDNISFNGNDKWRFLNKGTGTNANAVRLQNGAQNNSFKDMILEGSDENSGFTGTIYIGSGTTVGNSNNTFESNRISSNADRRLEPIIIGISNNFMPGLGYGAVINASNTTPVIITTPMNHGFTTGQDITIEGVHGNTAANGTWQITVTGPKTFQLDGSTGSGDFRVNYFMNAMTATSPITLQTADQEGNTINHGIPINGVFPIAWPGFAGSSLTYSQSTSADVYYIKAISANEVELYIDAAATIPVNLTGGTWTLGSGSLNFLTDSRLWKPQATAPVLTTNWRNYGNGSIFIWITNVTKLGSGLIEVTTSANHNLISGWSVRMADVDGASGNLEQELNRWAGWQIDVTGPDKFTLRNSNGANGGVDVTGAYISGGRFLVSPKIVSSNNHGLITGNPVSINGVQGVYMANGTHYVRRLDNNAFSIWENTSGADSTKPRFLSVPGITSQGNSPGVLTGSTGFTGTPVFTRPGIPFYTNRAITNFTYLNNSPSPGLVTFVYTCAAGTFGAQGIGKRIYVSVLGINGITGTSPNQEWQGSNAFGIITATNQFTVTITGSSGGSYTSGGTFNNNITISSITPTQYGCNSVVMNSWFPEGCAGSYNFLPQINFSRNTGLRVNDDFTISGITGPTPNHPYNGNFKAISGGFQGNGGSTMFGAFVTPTTAPIINTGGVPNMTADPNPPFNGQVVAAYDILANRLVFSQNTGNSLNSSNKIKNNELSQFDEVAISISSLGNGSNWEITGNSIYNKISQPPAAGASSFQGINFVPGLKSNNNMISNNFIGGQTAGAAGNAMVFSRGISMECFNLNVGNEIVTKVENNLIRNLNAISFSGSVGAVQGFNLNGGRIDLKNNIVGGTDNAGPEDTIRVGGAGSGVTYLARIQSTDSVSMVGNTFAHIQMPGAVDHTSVVSVENALKLLFKGNRMYKLSADFSFFDRTITFIRLGARSAVTLDGSTNGTITWPGNHGFAVGDYVRIEGLVSNTPANGTWRIASVPNATQFVLDGYTGSGSSGTNSGTGIRIPNRVGLSVTIDSNEVHSNQTNNGGSGMSTVTMVFVGAAEAKGTITRNRFYNNVTLRQGNFLTVWGPTNQGSGFIIANNQVSIVGAGPGFSPRCHGILNEMPHNPGQIPGALPKIYFNTFWLRNNSGNSSSIIYGYRKNGSGRAVVRNNIFFGAPSTSPGGVVYGVGVNNTSNWTGSDYTNNLLYAEGSNAFLAQWTTTSISTIPNWQGFAGAGSVDNIFNYANFEDVQPSTDGNLKLSSDNCPIKDKGVNVAYFADYDSLLVRDVAKPDLGSNEFSRFLPRGAFWTGAVNNDWNTDANWCDQRVPLADEDVTITNAPAKPFMPIISTPDAVCRNLNVANNSGSMLVIYGENAALTVSGKTPQIRFAHDNLSNITGSVRFITDSVQNIPGSATELNFPGRNVLRSRPRIISLTFTNNPDEITINATGHGLALGDQVLLANVRGATVPAKPLKVIQIIDANNFRLSGLASGTYTANSGTIIPLAMIPINAMSNGPSAITITTSRTHNLLVGQMVAISGSRGNVRANGSFEVATTPTATTFTINVVSTDAFVYDTSAYAFPGRTGYFDVVVDGNSQKEASGIIEARTLTIAGGDLNLPFGQADLTNTLIRDSLIISGNRTVNLAGANYRFGNLINKGGTVSFPTANVQINDSLTTRGGSLSISAGTISSRNLAVLGGGTLNLGSGNATVSDSIMVFGGTINKTAGNVDVGRRINLRSGNVVLGTGGTLTLTNPAGNIIGGSASSYVEGILAQAVNSIGGQVGTATSITTVANSTPIRITRTGHGLQTGDRVRITGSSPSGVNGLWNVIRIDANNFDLVGTTALGAGSGGTFTRFGFGIQGGTTSGTPIVVTSTAHGLNNGDVVRVMNNTANPRANGVWTVANASANTFELSGTIGDGSSTSGANVGTVVRLETRNFPIGKGANYRPTSLHLAQGFTTAKLYTAEYKEAAPQTLNMPVDQPVYGAPGLEAVSTVALSSFHTLSQSAPAQAIDAGSLTLSYGTTEGVTIHNRRGLTVVKDSVPHDTWLHLYATSIDSTSAIRLLRTTRNFTTFSDFTLGFLLDVPLGLDLVDFQARLVKNAVSCHWTTVNERDMQLLTLERSVDGKKFTLLSSHEPKGGQSIRSQYAHMDEQALQLGVGKLYYRLRLLETNGRVSYSPVRVVDLNAGALENMAVYPSPFQKEVIVDLNLRAGEAVELEVADVLGRNVWTRSLTWNPETATQSLDLSALPLGAYMLKVKTDFGQELKKLVKQ
jgi:hypothetical protein